MKKLCFILLTALFFVGCSYSTAPKASTYITDFRPYAEQGFIITPATTGFTYEPVAQITVEVVPGQTLNYWTGTIQTTETLTFDEAMEKLVNDAKELGANGILDFKIQSIGSMYSLSGFAVKIIE